MVVFACILASLYSDRMHELTISNATRGALGEAVSRARFAGERTTIYVRGKPAAVLVSLEDAERLPPKREQEPA